MQNWRRRTGWFRENSFDRSHYSLFFEIGFNVLIIINDIVTTEDAKHVRKMLKGYLAKNGLSVSRPVLVPIRPYGKTLR